MHLIKKYDFWWLDVTNVKEMLSSDKIIPNIYNLSDLALSKSDGSENKKQQANWKNNRKELQDPEFKPYG